MNENEIRAEIERLNAQEAMIYASTGGLNQVMALDALYDEIDALIDDLETLLGEEFSVIDRMRL